MRDKKALVNAIIDRLLADRDAMAAAARSTHEAATHPESKPENDKDTRGLELAYLAGAQAERVRDIDIAVTEMRLLEPRAFEGGARIAATALVTLDDGDDETTYFLVPHGGGQKVDEIVVVTPPSPIGRAILGREEGDTVTVVLRGKPRELTIVAVS